MCLLALSYYDRRVLALLYCAVLCCVVLSLRYCTGVYTYLMMLDDNMLVFKQYTGTSYV